jgi:hypothetical protein
MSALFSFSTHTVWGPTSLSCHKGQHMKKDNDVT